MPVNVAGQVVTHSAARTKGSLQVPMGSLATSGPDEAVQGCQSMFNLLPLAMKLAIVASGGHKVAPNQHPNSH